MLASMVDDPRTRAPDGIRARPVVTVNVPERLHALPRPRTAPLTLANVLIVGMFAIAMAAIVSQALSSNRGPIVLTGTGTVALAPNRTPVPAPSVLPALTAADLPASGTLAGYYLPNGYVPNSEMLSLYDSLVCQGCAALGIATSDAVAQALAGGASVQYFAQASAGAADIRAVNAMACAADQGRLWQFRQYAFAHPAANVDTGYDEGMLAGWGPMVGIPRQAEYALCVKNQPFHRFVERAAASARPGPIPYLQAGNYQVTSPALYDETLLLDMLNVLQE
jgi:hypothetical protein